MARASPFAFGGRRVAGLAVALVAVLALSSFAGAGATSVSAGPSVPPALSPAVAFTNVPTPSSSAPPALSPGSVGSVVRTAYLNYNGTSVGNFPSSVYDWIAGTATVDPLTDQLWIPEWPASILGIPAPTTAPALVYDPADNQTQMVANLTNTSALAFDPITGDLYATEPFDDDVLVFNPVTETIVHAPIPVGTDPMAILYDSASENLYAVNTVSSNVTVINGTSDLVEVPGISVGTSPVALADDTTDRQMFIAVSTPASIWNISTKSNGPGLRALGLPSPATSMSYSMSTDLLGVGMPASRDFEIYDPSTLASTFLGPVEAGISSVASTISGTYFVVANDSGLNLTLVDATTGGVLAQHPPAGNDPARLTTDLSTDFVFAWSGLNRTVSQVNLTTDSLRQTSPSLAVQAETLAYDPDSGYVYIAGRLSENLVVLNASTLTTVHPPVLLPGEPTSLVDDSATGVVYVAYTGGVVAVDALTGSITTRNAALPGNNTQLVVDSVADLLWDVNSNLGLVALDLSTLAVDLTPGLIHGMPNLQGVAFDPATNELFAVDLFNSTIAVVNATTGREMTPAISGVAGAISVTYDPADQSIYALGRSVWIIDPATRTVVGGPIAITPHVAAWSIVYDPSREYLYVASNTTLNGSCPGNVTVIDGSSVAASQEGAYATIAVGQLPVDIQPVQLAGGSAPGSSEIWVTNLVSGTVSVIASPPTITYFAASPNPVDLGANTTILVGLDGGAGASQMSFSGLPSGCVSSDATSIRCTPDSGGSYTIQATAVDTLGQTTSATAVLSVSPSLILHTTFSTSPDAQVDLGQSMSATATTSGGNAPYNYTWNFGDSMAAWGQSVTHTYAATGVYLVTLLVADAGGGDSSLTSTVTVVGLPTLTISVSPSNITDVGKIIDLSGTVSGGTTPGSASWTFGDGAVATGSSVSHAYTSSGIYFATFHYIDATGVNVSKFMMVQVNPALGASLAVSPNPSTSTVRPGTALVFSTSLSGGTEPYTVVWSFDDGSYGYGLSVSHTYATAGKYNVTLFVEDAVGAEWNASYSVTVQAPSTGGLGAGFGTGLILGLLIGGAAAAIVLFGATRSRHSPPRPPTAFVPPASGTERDETQPWRES